MVYKIVAVATRYLSNNLSVSCTVILKQNDDITIHMHDFIAY